MQQEILFPPLSYLEVVGEVSYTTTKLGAVWKEARFVTLIQTTDYFWCSKYYIVTQDILSWQVVRIIPLQIIANLNSPGLEELIGMRKKLHIDR
jgi:hypothetical protein